MYLSEMAYPRGKAIHHIEDRLPYINEHLIKCVLYGDSTNSLHHWINAEIAPALYDIANIRVKTSGQKLTQSDYSALFESEFGEDEFDAAIGLRGFVITNRNNNQYPNIEPTEANADKLFRIYRYFKNEFANLFASNISVSEEDIKTPLWNLLG